MSFKMTAAAAAITLATAFSPKAEAQQCDADWVNTSKISKTLFATPVDQWNKPLIASLGQDNINALVKEVSNTWPRSLNGSAKNLFDNIERQQKNQKDVNWDNVYKNTSPVVVPVMKEVEQGLPVDQARNKATVAVTQYVSDAVATIAGIEPKEPACLVLPTPPAPSPAK